MDKIYPLQMLKSSMGWEGWWWKVLRVKGLLFQIVMRPPRGGGRSKVGAVCVHGRLPAHGAY